jgi:hypothetical protein
MTAAATDLAARFAAAHPGYAKVRPAPEPVEVSADVAGAMWDTTRNTVELLRDRALDALGCYPAGEAEWLRGMADPDTLRLCTTFARADFVLGPDGPRLVEVNVGPTIGGMGILDRYAEVLGHDDLPRPVRVWARALRALAGRERPDVVFVAADEETGVPHPYETAHFLAAEGIEARVEGTAWRGQADLVYGCFTYDQVAGPPYRDFVERAMATYPVYVAPPAFTLPGNKTLLAGIDDELVARTWVAQGAMLAEAARHPERYVLKPAVGYGGRGVVIGAKSRPAVWDAALDGVRDDDHRWVLQSYVPPHPVTMSTSDGPVAHEIGLGCIFVAGEPGGLLFRQVPVGSAGTANVARGALFGGARVVAA